MSAVKSSKRPVDFSDSEREESEYETDGDEYERSPVHKRVDEPEHEYEEEEEHYEEDTEVNGASEEEEVCECILLFCLYCLFHNHCGEVCLQIVNVPQNKFGAQNTIQYLFLLSFEF